MKRIQHNEEYISQENIDSNINTLWGEIFPILEHRKYLYNRFARVQDFDKDEVQVALEYYISVIASGYFGGKEPQYNVRKLNETQKGIVKKIFDKVFGEKNNPENFQATIDFITRYNDNASFFYDCVKDYINTGACYGLIYENEDNEIVYAHTSSLNTIAIWDYSTPSQKIGLIRYWIENVDNGIKRHIEVITKDYKKEYVDGIAVDSLEKKADFKEKEPPKNVLWNDVPIFAVENIDGLALYENVISLIKKFEQVIKNNANTFQYNDDAKLQVTGFTPQNDILIESRDKDGNIETDENGQPIMIQNPARVKEDNLILNSKIFYTPDGNGHIDWIIKNLNDTASENHKKTLLDLSLMISGVPNVTDIGFTNADNASALEKKFFPLDQVLQQADHEFKKELLRLWEIITDRINVKKNTNYDFRDIDVILIRNIPSNVTEVVNNWLRLRGLVADSTIIDNLPYDLDAESEQVKIDEQNEANLEKNIANMQKMSQAQGENVATQQPNQFTEQIEDNRNGVVNGMELS